MGKAREVLADDVREHPAVLAWGELSPRRVEPGHVIVLKEKQRGAVYGLAGAGPGGSRVIAKRCDRSQGIVERAVYAEVLPGMAGRPLECYGVVERDDSIWLFLEDAGGEPYSPDVPDHREAAARWIGELQTAVGRGDVKTGLPGRGPEHYRGFLGSILEALPRFRDRGAEVLDPIVSMCKSLESSWGEVEALCGSAPEALVHGDCLSKNVRVREGRVAVFDWGGAGWGLAATDLGQLALPLRGPPDDEPACEAYLDVARRRWPRLDIDTVRRLAILGQLFWALKVISRGMEEFEQEWREPEHILADFRIYADALARSA
ncbi:MAG: phosphotransferase [Planctomycetota bacterium]|jgi:hypothetical protein